MGQYYRFCCREAGQSLRPGGAKLTEHARCDDEDLDRLLWLVTDGPWKGLGVTDCGDYAWGDGAHRARLQRLGHASDPWRDPGLRELAPGDLPGKAPHYRFVANLDRGVYYDRGRCPVQWVGAGDDSVSVFRMDPLPILLAVGNGLGLGDYSGPGEGLAGSWAQERVLGSKERPEGLKEVSFPFTEEAVELRAPDPQVRDAWWASGSASVAALKEALADPSGARERACEVRGRAQALRRALPMRMLREAHLVTWPDARPLVEEALPALWGRMRLELLRELAVRELSVVAVSEQRPEGGPYASFEEEALRQRSARERVAAGLGRLALNCPDALCGPSAPLAGAGRDRALLVVPSWTVPDHPAPELERALGRSSGVRAALSGRCFPEISCSAPLSPEAEAGARSRRLLELLDRSYQVRFRLPIRDPGLPGGDRLARSVPRTVETVSVGALSVPGEWVLPDPGELGRPLEEVPLTEGQQRLAAAFDGACELWQRALAPLSLLPGRLGLADLLEGEGPLVPALRGAMKGACEALASGAPTADVASAMGLGM